VDFKESKENMDAVLSLFKNDLLKGAHDCSKGGVAVAVSELCMQNNIGCKVYLDKIPGEKISHDRLLFSESHSRYLLVAQKQKLAQIKKILSKSNVTYDVIGSFEGDHIQFKAASASVVDLSVDKVQKRWMRSLEDLVLHG
ncbi:MAG TPA: AIR synthase-related protein, partial [Nitrosopumilaceae archaeon]|nr:AIR synthase-related protein [Nitrosopumilaceae archaeon]